MPRGRIIEFKPIIGVGICCYARTLRNARAYNRHRYEEQNALDHLVDGIAPARWRLAASKVLRNSMAIVIGPTPPGTGVIALALCFTVSNSTSPTSREPEARLESSIRLIPTSMTTAP